MPEKFPISKQEKPKKKEEGFDFSFEDISDLLNLAADLEESIKISEAEEKIANGGNIEEETYDFNEKGKEKTETTEDRIRKIQQLKSKRGTKEDAEKKEIEKAENQKRAELVIKKLFSTPYIFKRIFKNSGKIDYETLNNLIKINFKEKNGIKDETKNDSLAIEVDVNKMPSLKTEEEKEKFVKNVVKTAEDEFLKTLTNIESQSLLIPDEQEYDAFIKLKIPQEIISGLENLVDTTEKSNHITLDIAKKITPLLEYLRRDIKFQLSFSLSYSIEKYLSNSYKEKLEEYKKEYKDKLFNIMDYSYRDEHNFLNEVKKYLKETSEKEKKEGEKETISENRLIKNILLTLENLAK